MKKTIAAIALVAFATSAVAGPNAKAKMSTAEIKSVAVSSQGTASSISPEALFWIITAFMFIGAASIEPTKITCRAIVSC